MTFTVRDLVEVESLKTRLLAGRQGEHRAIRCAHTCELAAPWEWLGLGDLLMTHGRGVPDAAEEQVAFVRRLDASRIAGMAIDELHVRSLSTEMLAEAARIGLPILGTAHDVAFIAVAQEVAQANRRVEQEQLRLTMRIHEAVREEARREPLQLVRRIADDLAAQIYVVDSAGDPLLGGDPLDVGLREQVAAAIAKHGRTLPAVIALPDGGRGAVVVPVPASDAACLVVRCREDIGTAPAVLQHVAAVVAIGIERRVAQREVCRRLGSELLAHLIDRRIDTESGRRRLADFELAGSEMVLAAVEVRRDETVEAVHREMSRAGVPNLDLRRAETLYLLTAGDSTARVESVLGEELFAGFSEPVAGVAEVPDAAKQARWALQAARRRRRSRSHYGRDAPPFMPRTVSEARNVADDVLGDLLAYDAEHAGNLVRSLREFLTANRSWQRAAATLGVHKQTLVYRMRRVEELTGRQLDDTGDVAELWLALKAHDLLSQADEPMSLQ